MLFASFLQRWHAVDRLCANFLQRLHVLHAYLHAFTPGDMREVDRDYHRLTEVNRGTNWDLNANPVTEYVKLCDHTLSILVYVTTHPKPQAARGVLFLIARQSQV
jgi:hypothetical protein